MHCTLSAIGFPLFRFLGVLCAAAFFVTTPIQASALCDKDPECDDLSAWVAFTQVSLRQSILGSDEVFEWLGSFNHKALDISIDVARHGPKEELMKGTVGLVGGQIMLTKGLKLQPGLEIDTLDAPVLSMRLVMILLKRVFPNGPDQIVGPTDIDQTSRVGIKYATPSASGYIPAPWHVKGKVSKLPDGALHFELTLSFLSQQQGEQSSSFTMNTKGELAVLGSPVFRDTDSLEGWTIYGIGPQTTKQGTSTFLDYGAKPREDTGFKTIGDIRAFIAAENHPGIRDVTKDFTGFWKQKCDEPFGLQIKHYGDEDKYSIVFCGPGGCGDPSQGRLTFITGDKGYEPVSEGELIVIARSGDRKTYYRCTKDTNPVLK